MFDYELHQFRTAELAAQAAHHGLVREARKAAKTRRTLLGREAAEARPTAERTRPTTHRPDRYSRAA
ncbi:hypothetical protein [Streptomyces spectabilis]|uniref:Uncharacterized protein n=1 Tax=Streptomyces spectabilis TaxID=68270 RepID=A0A5P2XLZ1_STRST|nr:hypothetical protein [Streptomyces spectabilis]MBB5105443.1 hypothetical protein [Streptomyces spectabilis]MCI3906632.1 hypothetical protein [Streptomyces spectabilis]QEV63452.1 hypothetical protein CP982_36070 [Streptomyces spectabilis]